MKQLVEPFDQRLFNDLLKLSKPVADVIKIDRRMARQQFNHINTILRTIGDDFLKEQIFQGEEANPVPRNLKFVSTLNGMADVIRCDKTEIHSQFHRRIKAWKYVHFLHPANRVRYLCCQCHIFDELQNFGDLPRREMHRKINIACESIVAMLNDRLTTDDYVINLLLIECPGYCRDEAIARKGFGRGGTLLRLLAGHR